MKCFRGVLVCFLVSALLGCQSQRSVTISEYRPAAPVVAERKAPESEIFQLIRWQPIAPLTAASTATTTRPAKPLKQMPVEVEQVYAPRAAPIGFRRQDGQLIAVAGGTTKSLEEAHYIWRSVPGSSDRDQDRMRQMNDIGTTIGAVVLLTVVAAVVVLIVHERRHTILDDLFNSN